MTTDMQSAASRLHELAGVVTRCAVLSEQLLKEKTRDLAIISRVEYLKRATADELRLIGGELTAQDIRTVRAFLKYILP